MLPQIVPACQVNLYFVKIKENTKILASFLFVDFADTVKQGIASDFYINIKCIFVQQQQPSPDNPVTKCHRHIPVCSFLYSLQVSQVNLYQLGLKGRM